MIPAGKRWYWVWGTALAIAGVFAARVGSQSFAADAQRYVRALGVLLALGGLFVIMLGTRRKS